MAVYLDAPVLQLYLKLVSPALAAVLGDHNTSHIQALVAEFLDQTEYVLVIGDTQVMAHFVFFNVSRIDDNDNLSLVGHLEKHAKLAVRFKSRKYPGSVIVVKELAPEFQVQLIPKFPDALLDVF